MILICLADISQPFLNGLLSKAEGDLFKKVCVI